MMFCIEIGAPFLIFAPRRLRFCGGTAIVFLQILILLTGNYTFFNLLTLALCLLLLDDFVLAKFVPAGFRTAFFPVTRHPSLVAPRRCPRFITVPLAGVVVVLSLFQINLMFGVRPGRLLPVAVLDEWLMPFRSFNGYGLFAVMTTERREIIVEGSNDGVNWLAYEFKYKPGDVTRRPAFVAPHQPRLDWQMWFAALGDCRAKPMVREFLSAAAARVAGCSGVAGEESISRTSTSLRPRGILRLPLHEFRRTPSHGRLVETRIHRGILAADFTS